MCKRTYRLVLPYFILLSSLLLTGCEKPGDIIKAVKIESEGSSVSKSLKTTTGANSHNEAPVTEVFAPTLDNERHGRWQGGMPPLNKRASGIDTYYRIKAEGQPNHLTMTLRFEGITADDAKVEFRPIDGAEFTQTIQRSQWRLKPNTVSEITFSLVVPDGTSYLTLDTFQNNVGSSRAFLLKKP